MSLLISPLRAQRTPEEYEAECLLYMYFNFQFSFFYGIPACVNQKVPDCCAFSWPLPSLCFVLLRCASFYIVSYHITSSYINLLSLEACLLSHDSREKHLGGRRGGEEITPVSVEVAGREVEMM